MRVSRRSHPRSWSLVSMFGLAVVAGCTQMVALGPGIRVANFTSEDTIATPPPAWATVYAALGSDRQRDTMLSD